MNNLTEPDLGKRLNCGACAATFTFGAEIAAELKRRRKLELDEQKRRDREAAAAAQINQVTYASLESQKTSSKPNRSVADEIFNGIGVLFRVGLAFGLVILAGLWALGSIIAASAGSLLDATRSIALSAFIIAIPVVLKAIKWMFDRVDDPDKNPTPPT